MDPPTRPTQERVHHADRAAGPGGDPQRILTARQWELLQACIRLGYYEIPRRVTLRGAAAQVGISPTSLSLALRRAEARLVRAHVAATARTLNDGLASTRKDGVNLGGGEHRSGP